MLVTHSSSFLMPLGSAVWHKCLGSMFLFTSGILRSTAVPAHLWNTEREIGMIQLQATHLRMKLGTVWRQRNRSPDPKTPNSTVNYFFVIIGTNTHRDSILSNPQINVHPAGIHTVVIYHLYYVNGTMSLPRKSKKAENEAPSLYFYILQLYSTAHHLKSHQTYQILIKVLLLWITVCPHLADSYVAHKFSM